MAIFDREQRYSRDEDGQLLLQGHDMIEQTAKAHALAWGLGSAERWDFDGASGTLRWTFSDHVAEAAAQIIGSYSYSDAAST